MFGQLALVTAAGLLGPLLAGGRRPLAPVLVGELVAGAILGRTGFGVIQAGIQPLPAFGSIGFAMLMLGAGTEVDIASSELRQGLARGAASMVAAIIVSIPVGLAIGAAFHLGPLALFPTLLAGSSAAVAFPIIEEGRLGGPAVMRLIGWITLADGLTALIVPLALTGPARIPGALAGDGAIVAICAAVIFAGAKVSHREVLVEAARESRQRRWALQLRLSVLLLLILGAIAERSGGSMLVAGFAAGIVLRRFHEPNRLVLQLSGLAAGFFVPAFFVLLGSTLDLRRLASDPAAIAVAVVMAIGAVAIHLAAALVGGGKGRLASGLLASAQLGLPAAAAALGLQTHALSPAIAAALVAGGCLTLIPATIGARLLAETQSGSLPAPQPPRTT